MKSVLHILTVAGLCVLATEAHAAQVTIDFDGLMGPWAGATEAPGNFYNGGLGTLGSGPGPDYGITFTPFGATSVESKVICNVANCATGNSLFIFGGYYGGGQLGAIMHIENGFRGVVEFDASISNIGTFATVFAMTEYGGHSIREVNVDNPDPNDTCGRLECAFHHYSFNLADDDQTPDDVVAHTIIFRTAGIDAVFIDNIKFHDLILADTPPVAVPEPSTALLIGGVGLIGAMLRRRRAVES